jgi:hypothetical protein
MKYNPKLVGKLICLGWEDSHENMGNAWKDDRDMQEYVDYEVVCISVGWVTAINKDRIVLASDLSSSSYVSRAEYWGRLTTIPLSCVQHMAIIATKKMYRLWK